VDIAVLSNPLPPIRHAGAPTYANLHVSRPTLNFAPTPETRQFDGSCPSVRGFQRAISNRQHVGRSCCTGAQPPIRGIRVAVLPQLTTNTENNTSIPASSALPIVACESPFSQLFRPKFPNSFGSFTLLAVISTGSVWPRGSRHRFVGPCYFYPARANRVGKERVLGCEPATCLRRACPTCGARAPRRRGLPVSDEAGVGLPGLLEPSSISVPHNAAVIGMRPAWPAPFRRRLTGEAKRPVSPIAASSPSATVTCTPLIVMSRCTHSSCRAG
jgi:hypothetical protein